MYIHLLLYGLLSLQRYCPGLSSLPTTNGPWSRGEGIQLGEALGAQLIHMEHVQVHPTGFVDPGDPDNGTKVWDLPSPGSVIWLVGVAAAAAAAAAAVMVTSECPCKSWQAVAAAVVSMSIQASCRHP